MNRKIKNEMSDFIHKCRSWIDNETYIPFVFQKKSSSDRFAERLIGELESIMEREKFHFHKNKILIPTIYRISVAPEENAEWYGVKREFLLKKLNDFVEGRLKLLSIETFNRSFVQIQTSQELKRGTIKIEHQWEESDLPIDIRFNHSCVSTAFDSEDFCERTSNTISFINSETGDDFEYPTILRSELKRLFCLGIWHTEDYQNVIPVYQPQVSLGRSSASIVVDIPLQNDLRVSRHHAVLKRETDNSFNLLVTGKNPVIVEGSEIFQGQSVNCYIGETINIGSYFIKLQNDLYQ